MDALFPLSAVPLPLGPSSLGPLDGLTAAPIALPSVSQAPVGRCPWSGKTTAPPLAMRPAEESAPVVKPAASSVLPITRGAFADFAQDMLAGFQQLHADHGPIAALEEGSQKIIFLFDPQYNYQVLSDAATFQARFFAIRGPKTSAQRKITCGLLAMNGEQHRRNRRVVKEPFGLKAIAGYRPVVSQLADEAIAGWKIGSQVDLNQELTKFMLRVTSQILFGLDDPALAYELGEQIFEWVTMNHEIGVGALVPNEGFSARYEELLDYAVGLERNVMELIRRRRNDPTPRRDVLSMLINSHGEEGGLSDEELVGQACVLFAAAHMTTAHSLTWTMFLLAQHPSVLERLEAEIASGLPAEPSLENSLLERVIKESMRVLPASAYSQRINAEPVQLGPFHLHRGTPIVFTPLITHKLPQLYDNAYRFTPDRWLTLKRTGYEYHPFGAGPRMCIGGPLAMEIIRTALPRFLSQRRFTLVGESEVTAEVHSTMLNPKSGVMMEIGSADAPARAVPVTGNIHELVDLVETPGYLGSATKGTPPARPR